MMSTFLRMQCQRSKENTNADVTCDSSLMMVVFVKYYLYNKHSGNLDVSEFNVTFLIFFCENKRPFEFLI